MKRSLVLLLALATLPVLLPGARAALDNPVTVTSASWGGNATTEAAPGDAGRVLSVSLQNVDVVTYTGAKATVADSAAVHPVSGGETATLSGDFAPGQVWSARFTVNVDPKADPNATLSIPVTLTMQPKGTTAPRDYALSVPARLTGRSVLVLSTNATTLPASARATLPLLVADVGTGAAGGVSLTVSAAQGGQLSVSGRDNLFSVGTLAPGASAEVDVPLLTPSQPGPQTLSLQLAYTNAAGASVQETRSLTVRVADPLPGPLQVSLGSARLVQNETGAVSFSVKNAGSASLGNVVASFRLPSGSPAPFSVLDASDNPSLGDLAPGASRTVTLDLLVASAASDAQPIVLTLSWFDDAGAQHAQSYNFTVRVAAQGPGAPSGLTASLASNRLDAGREDAMRFTLANGGSDPLLQPSVTFRLPASGLLAPVNASDAQSLPDLGAGNSTVVELDLLVAKSAADVYPLSMVVAWNDPAGGAHAQTFNFGVAVVGTVDVNLDGVTGSASATGTTVTLSGTLTNLGNAVAHNAYVSVEGGGYLPTQPVYLGDLDANTALPFTLAATPLNGTLPQGGFGNGTRPGGGTFGNGTRQGGNGTGFPVGGGRGGGAGRFGGPRTNATFVLTWNDDYGTIHTRAYDLAVAVRQANAATGSGATSSGSRSVPAPGLLAGLGVVALAALALGRRRGR